MYGFNQRKYSLENAMNDNIIVNTINIPYMGFNMYTIGLFVVSGFHWGMGRSPIHLLGGRAGIDSKSG
jgi:hypothetical protein